MKKIWIGLEGAGKDLHFAKLIEEKIYRNAEWKKKYGFTRPIITSVAISNKLKEFAEEKGIPIRTIETQNEIAELEGCDLFISELAVFFDARGWEKMPHELRVWLSQQSKRGVHFYGACQNWEQVDVSFRRLVPQGNLFIVRKIIGSNRPGMNLPPVNKIWGIYWIRDAEMDNITNKIKPFGIPEFHFIRKKYTGFFDTNAKTEIKKLTRKNEL